MDLLDFAAWCFLYSVIAMVIIFLGFSAIIEFKSVKWEEEERQRCLARLKLIEKLENKTKELEKAKKSMTSQKEKIKEMIVEFNEINRRANATLDKMVAVDKSMEKLSPNDPEYIQLQEEDSKLELKLNAQLRLKYIIFDEIERLEGNLVDDTVS